MPLVLLDTEIADLDLTSLVTILTHTPSATEARQCQAHLSFGDGVKDLDGTGGDFSIVVTVGGQTVEPSPQVVAFSTAVRTALWLTPFPVPANTEVIIRAVSPNVADADVGVSAILYDVPVGNTVQIAGTAAPNTAGKLHVLDGNGEAIATAEAVSNISTSTGGFGRLIGGFLADGAEVETNDFTATQQGDGIFHIVEPDGVGDTGFYYEADVGGTGVATSFTWRGYAQGNGSTIDVKYYNWATPGDPWKAIKSRTGTNQAIAVDDIFSVPTGATGTGGNSGLVRLRFESADAIAIATDFLQCVFSNTGSAVGYEGGQIFIDTLAGFPGNIENVNGVGDHACDNLADALILSVKTTMRAFHLATGSVVDLIADATGMVGVGKNWHLGLEGQLITAGYVLGATVTGSCDPTSVGTTFDDCHVGTNATAIVGVGPCEFQGGSLDTVEAYPLTFLANGSYQFHHVSSGVPGEDAPWVDMGSSVGVTTAEFRWWSGGLTVININTDYVVSIDALTGGTVTLGMAGGHVEARGAGMKALVVNGTSGTVNVSGFYGTITDNTAGNVTITRDWTFQTNLIGGPYPLNTDLNGSVALTPAERNATADAILTRNVSNVEDVAGTHSLCYVVLATSESNTVTHLGELTVFKTNGTSEFARKLLTTDTDADPVTGIG